MNSAVLLWSRASAVLIDSKYRSLSPSSHAATARIAGASQYRGVRIASRSVTSRMTARLMKPLFTT